jgi:hypothetical protein
VFRFGWFWLGEFIWIVLGRQVLLWRRWSGRSEIIERSLKEGLAARGFDTVDAGD